MRNRDRLPGPQKYSQLFLRIKPFNHNEPLFFLCSFGMFFFSCNPVGALPSTCSIHSSPMGNSMWLYLASVVPRACACCWSRRMRKRSKTTTPFSPLISFTTKCCRVPSKENEMYAVVISSCLRLCLPALSLSATASIEKGCLMAACTPFINLAFHFIACFLMHGACYHRS